MNENTTRLSEEETINFIKLNPEWALVAGRLEKTFLFPSFARAIVFVNKIINPIEEFQSYPMIKISYNRVLVSLFNHMQGHLSKTELQMAQEMDKLK